MSDSFVPGMLQTVGASALNFLKTFKSNMEALSELKIQILKLTLDPTQ